MPELKKHSRKLDMAAAVRRNTRGLIFLLASVTLGALIVVGQQRELVTKNQIPVFDRLKNAVKAKEPKFKLDSSLERNNQDEKYVSLGWLSGEDLVATTAYELASPAEAAELMRKSLAALRSVPVQTIKLTQLGDEAYMFINTYRKESHTNLFLRKGNYFIVMSASSQDLAKRFAKHMAQEIDN